jgi:hypothetical protein
VWSLCHDDGSFAYVDTYNFLPWSGTKNYLGFNKTSIGNMFVYSDYSPALLSREVSPHTVGLGNGWDACAMSYGTHALPPELADKWSRNTCITRSSSAFFSFNGCNDANPNDGGIPLFSSNSYFSDDGGWEMTCGKTKWNLSQAQALGVDAGSTAGLAPGTADIIQQGRALLQF